MCVRRRQQLAVSVDVLYVDIAICNTPTRRDATDLTE